MINSIFSLAIFTRILALTQVLSTNIQTVESDLDRSAILYLKNQIGFSSNSSNVLFEGDQNKNKNKIAAHKSTPNNTLSIQCQNAIASILSLNFNSKSEPHFSIHKESEGWNYYTIGIVSNNGENEQLINMVFSEKALVFSQLKYKKDNYYRYMIKSVSIINPIELRDILQSKNLELDPRYVENISNKLLIEITENIKKLSNEFKNAK